MFCRLYWRIPSSLSDWNEEGDCDCLKPFLTSFLDQGKASDLGMRPFARKGVNVVTTFFGDFCQFSAKNRRFPLFRRKKSPFLLKTNVLIILSAFLPILGEKIGVFVENQCYEKILSIKYVHR
jgi:hypothetical protein